MRSVVASTSPMASIVAPATDAKVMALVPKHTLSVTPVLSIQSPVRSKQVILMTSLIQATALAAGEVVAKLFVDEVADDSYKDAWTVHQMKTVEERNGTDEKRWQFAWKTIASVFGGPRHLP